jgi:flavodoxin
MRRSDAISRRAFLAPSLLLPLLLPAVSAGAPVLDAAGAKPRKGNQVLVAYFSRSGNTRVIAGQIQRALGAALFEIQPARPYPEDYFETVEQARCERDAGVKPPLATVVPDMASYRTVYLGFPIWGETAPPVIRSFLSAHDLSGKTLIPFITHGGYGAGDSLAVVTAHARGARIHDAGLVMQADQERQTLERVTGWLRDIRQG